MIVKIGHNDIYSYVINLDTENQQLKKKQDHMKGLGIMNRFRWDITTELRISKQRYS